MSTLATSVRSAASRPRPTRTSTSCARSTAASPRNGSEQLLRGEVVDHLRGGDRVERGRSEDDVGDRLGEDAADAEHHGGPELRIADDAGDQLTVARDHRGDEDGHVAVVGRRSGEQFGGGGLDGGRSARRSLTSPRSVLWAMASPFSLATTG